MSQPPTAAEPAGSPVASGASGAAGAVPEQRRRPALSPSRAADFKQCPLLYRFRAVDRLPEARTRGQVRGSVVHAVLERLYALPAAERGPEAARALVAPAWEELAAADPALAAELFDGAGGDAEVAGWLESARELVDTYFALEDPRRVQPEACELRVEVELPGPAGPVLLRGFVDRLDAAPTGELRVVDYKTGAAPREVFEAKALFQMKFYALVLLRTRGVVPRQLRLLYLADRQCLTYTPDEAELSRFERTLTAIWAAILRAARTGDFRPSPSKLCGWCSHQDRCPSFGGTPPPWPGWPDGSPDATGAEHAAPGREAQE